MNWESEIRFVRELNGADIYVKRDDQIPFSFGGNKVRIAKELMKNLKERGFTSIVSYGSSASNMNRAVSAMALAEGIPCHVVMKRDSEEELAAEAPLTLNERLVLAAGADVTYCIGATVGETVERVLNEAKERGERPYYIYGNSRGQGNRTALMMASFKEYGEIRSYEEKNGIRFDHIFLAVGTGATISGLVAGERTEITVERAKEGTLPQIHGISVARSAEAEREVILENLRSFNPAVLDPESDSDGFTLTDRYVGNGYGDAGEGIRSTIYQMYSEYGIPLDPVYTGKAFYGMTEEIRRNGLEGNILFLHTGGFPDLLDTLSGMFFLKL